MNGATDLGNGIFRIDGHGDSLRHPCYSYLIADGGFGILIDPGPAQQFPRIYSSVLSLLPLERISYFILTSELPDVCSSLPRWVNSGFSGTAIIHRKAAHFVGLDVKSMDLRIMEGEEDSLTFGDGRELRLVGRPGLPTAGAIFCYDGRSKSLFSGMPFGSTLGEKIPEAESLLGIETFYADQFSHLGKRGDIQETLESLGAARILPRTGPPVVEYVPQAAALYALGRRDRQPAQPDDGFYPQLITELNKGLADLFSTQEVDSVLNRLAPDSGITKDGKALLDTYCEGLLRLKGPLWLSAIHVPLVCKLQMRGLQAPDVFLRYGREIEQGMAALIADLNRLRAENLELQKSIIQASDDQLKDPVTGFYNEIFFQEYVASLPEAGGDTVLFLRLDGIQQLNQRFGAKTGDMTLKGLGYFLLNNKRTNSIFFRMNGPLFACLLQGEGKDAALEYARELKTLVEESEQFVQRISISAAIVDLGELDSALLGRDLIFSSLMKIGKERIKLLDKLGPSSICAESEITIRRNSGTVLLIEGNAFEADILKRVLEDRGFETHSVTDGSEAVVQADLHRPDVIISEIFIPQMDGFQIRRRLRASPDLKNIPFILVSREKSEATVLKALDLDIRYFFRKPVLAAELAGTIMMLVRESASERHP